MSDHLCVSCNMCCDGTLFGYVEVTAQEQTRLGAGPDIREIKGRLAMRQACTKLGQDGMCGCYAVRPQKCDAFNCKLLKALEAGEVDEAYARFAVTHAKRMREVSLHAFHALIPEQYLPLEPRDRTNPRRCMNALQEALRDGANLPKHHVDLAEKAYLMFAMMLSETFAAPET